MAGRFVEGGGPPADDALLLAEARALAREMGALGGRSARRPLLPAGLAGGPRGKALLAAVDGGLAAGSRRSFPAGTGALRWRALLLALVLCGSLAWGALGLFGRLLAARAGGWAGGGHSAKKGDALVPVLPAGFSPASRAGGLPPPLEERSAARRAADVSGRPWVRHLRRKPGSFFADE